MTTLNSFGGSYAHQDLLNQYIQALARGLTANAEGLQSPCLPELLAAITTIMVPHNHVDIGALAHGKEAVSDGKFLLINQESLVQHANGSTPNEWFEQVMRDVIAIAQGKQPSHQVHAVSSEEMENALQPILQRQNNWREMLGYDLTRRDQKPVLNALALIEGGQRNAPTGRMGMGDYNRNASTVIATLFQRHDPRLAEPSEQRTQAILAANLNLHPDVDLHSPALQMFSVIGLSEQILGRLTKEKDRSFDETMELAQELSHYMQSGISRELMIDALSELHKHGSGQFQSDLLKPSNPRHGFHPRP